MKIAWICYKYIKDEDCYRPFISFTKPDDGLYPTVYTSIIPIVWAILEENEGAEYAIMNHPKVDKQ